MLDEHNLTDFKVIPQYCFCASLLRTTFASLARANERVHLNNARDFPPFSHSRPQAPVVPKVDNAIHRINRYPVDSVVCFVNTYPLDTDLSGG